ncbi:MAG: OB-fold domain-containing protein [Thermodesulfobacteriota bacterium]
MEDRPFTDYSFDQYLGEDKLMGSKCLKCGALYVPPRPQCIECRESAMSWFEACGQGRLKAFTCIAVGPPRMREEGYGRRRPYCTGVVELIEGPRVVARIVDVDANNPASITIGMPLTMQVLRRDQDGQERRSLAFHPG